MTTEEKLKEVQDRFNQNIAKAQDLESQLKELQQPLIEDQGAIKILKELL